MNLLNGTSSFKKTQTHNSDMCSILVIYDYMYWGTHSGETLCSIKSFIRSGRLRNALLELLFQSIIQKVEVKAETRKKVRKSTWAVAGDEQPGVPRCGRADSCNPPRRTGAEFTRHQSC